MKIGQLVRHQRYGTGTIRSLFASYALVEFDRPFLEKTVLMGHLHLAAQAAGGNGQNAAPDRALFFLMS